MFFYFILRKGLNLKIADGIGILEISMNLTDGKHTGIHKGILTKKDAQESVKSLKLSIFNIIENVVRYLEVCLMKMQIRLSKFYGDSYD